MLLAILLVEMMGFVSWALVKLRQVLWPEMKKVSGTKDMLTIFIICVIMVITTLISALEVNRTKSAPADPPRIGAAFFLFPNFKVLT